MKISEVASDKLLKTIIAANNILNNFSNLDPFYIAQQYNIRVIFCDLKDNVNAFSSKDAFGVTFYINKRADSHSRKLLCAHELGHYFNGDIDTAPALFYPTIDPEKEFLANTFLSIVYPQSETRLNADYNTDISEFNSYFDSQIKLCSPCNNAPGELKILNDSSTIFDI